MLILRPILATPRDRLPGDQFGSLTPPARSGRFFLTGFFFGCALRWATSNSPTRASSVGVAIWCPRGRSRARRGSRRSCRSPKLDRGPRGIANRCKATLAPATPPQPGTALDCGEQMQRPWRARWMRGRQLIGAVHEGGRGGGEVRRRGGGTGGASRRPLAGRPLRRSRAT